MDIQKRLQELENELIDFSCYEDQLNDKEELLNCFNKLKEAINFIPCCTELNTYFKKGDKVIACGKLEGKVVSSKTETMVKVEIKGTTIGINARSLELKSI